MQSAQARRTMWADGAARWVGAALAGVVLEACAVDDRELGVIDRTVRPEDGGATDNGSPSCVPEETECLSVTRVRRCSSLGQWSAPEECEQACVGGECGGVCKPGQTRCASPSEVETCSSEGQWYPATACASSCSGDACIGECTPSTARCSPSNAGVPQLCSADGVWQDQSPCPFVCTSSGICTGECDPNTERCHPETGVPQRCDDSGTFQDQPACGTGETCVSSAGAASCSCQRNLTPCDGGCFDLDNDPNNCGACGHDCQGQDCSGRQCAPATLATGVIVTYRMALSQAELFFISSSTDGTGDLYRVPKQGGGRVAIALTTDLHGVAVDGTTVYYAFYGPSFEFQVVRLESNDNLVTFTSAEEPPTYGYRRLVEFSGTGAVVGTESLQVSGGFVYWSASGYRRAQTSSATPVATGELLGTEPGTLLLAPADNCVYGVGSDQSSILRACTGGSQATVHVAGGADGSFHAVADIVADASGVYFSEMEAGIKRLALSSDTPTITTLAASSTVPTALALDDSFVYFIDGADRFSPCTNTMSINRVSKSGGEVTPIVSSTTGCPKFVSVDDTFVYWAEWADSGESGSILKVAK
jgi:hypothetical protein